MFARLFPGSIQILDFYHAGDHLACVGEAMYGKGTSECIGWQRDRHCEVRQSRVKHVLKALASRKPTDRAGHTLRRTTFRYFRNNAERMDYKTYLERGCHIGSGGVEAGCKQVLAQRLDQAGRHWRQETAEAIVALRAAHLCAIKPDMTQHLAMYA